MMCQFLVVFNLSFINEKNLFMVVKMYAYICGQISEQKTQTDPTWQVSPPIEQGFFCLVA